jgi:hypothetical protein
MAAEASVRSRANLEKGGLPLHHTMAAHDASAPDARPSAPPITFCPLHGLQRRQCGSWCLKPRWAFYFAAADLERYFKGFYRRD